MSEDTPIPVPEIVLSRREEDLWVELSDYILRFPTHSVHTLARVFKRPGPALRILLSTDLFRSFHEHRVATLDKEFKEEIREQITVLRRTTYDAILKRIKSEDISSQELVKLFGDTLNRLGQFVDPTVLKTQQVPATIMIADRLTLLAAREKLITPNDAKRH